jgi:hypothetical protein
MVVRADKVIIEKVKPSLSKKDNRGRNRGTSLLEQQPKLIDEICDYLRQGATDTCICRIIGINPATFSHWKSLGKEENGDVYESFYREYQINRGKRELAWLDGIEGKWLLTHHPDTKNDYAEVRYQKQEFSLTAAEEEVRKAEMQHKIDEGLKNLEYQIDGAQLLEEPEEVDYTEDGEYADNDSKKQKQDDGE